MIIKKHITHFAGTTFLLLFLLGCEEKEITITKDYVINPNWDEMDNELSIVRMNLINNSDNINLNNVSPSDLLEKLTKDTCFSYETNIKFNGVEYAKRKVYFNRNNGFVWIINPRINFECETIGELQRNTWYKLSGLSNIKTLHYIYIDSLNNVRLFKVPASYWTNI